MKWIFPLLILFFLSGCSSQLELGNKQYALGNYNQAASYWNPAAQAGDPYAQFNVGLLWEGGLGSTPKNKNEASQWFLLSAKQGYVPAMVKLARIQFDSDYNETAISWLNLAARWNNTEAKTLLNSKGLTAPYPDLYEQQQINEAAAIQNYANILTGVIGAYTSTYSTPQKTSPTYQSTYRPQAPTQVLQEASCSSDFSCGVGFQCVKAPLKSTGVCMQSVNEYGTREFTIPNTNSIGPNMNMNGQCSFTTDCPIGFSCDTKLKACVKK